MLTTFERAAAATSDNDLERRRWRVYLVAAVIVGIALSLTARLVELQVLQSAHFSTMATDEHWRRTVLPPRRGDIVDTNGDPLATSVTYQSLYASTDEIEDPAHVATVLAPLLKRPAKTLEAMLSKKQSAPTLVQAWLPDDVATKIEQLGITGLFLQLEPKRAYPQGNLAAQLLGVVGVDDNGLSGIELAYNHDLAGEPGELIAERDSTGDAIALGPHKYTAPTNGSTLTLTLDRYVQWVAERELRTAVDRYQARGGTVVVLDPHSGAILALASVPTFRFDDPNLYSRANVALFNIPAVNQAAEPGSLFRLISFAAALDSGSIAPDTSFVNTGTLTYLGGSVRDSSQRSPGPETMSQALALSSEVGTTWAAARVGAPNFYRYARAFGLGQSTNSGLPGEVGGLLRLPADADWLPFDLITNAYGQGVWATPLQMTVAFAAIANGGTMMKPYVVQKIWGSAGDRAYFPTIEGQVIRKETASSLTRMLVATVDGTTHDQASAARVPGYAVAGAEGITPGANDGSAGATPELASFAGYAPANAPRFVIVVWIVAPRQVPSGEAAAAPVFQSIAQQLLNYYQIPPSVPRQNNGM